MKRVIVNASKHFIPHSWFVTDEESVLVPWKTIQRYRKGGLDLKETVNQLCDAAYRAACWTNVKPEPFSPSPTWEYLTRDENQDSSLLLQTNDPATPSLPINRALSTYMWVRENFDFVAHKTLDVEFVNEEQFKEFMEIFPMSTMSNLERRRGRVRHNGSYAIQLFMTFEERFALSRLKENHGFELVVGESH